MNDRFVENFKTTDSGSSVNNKYMKNEDTKAHHKLLKTSDKWKTIKLAVKKKRFYRYRYTDKGEIRFPTGNSTSEMIIEQHLKRTERKYVNLGYGNSIPSKNIFYKIKVK